MRKYLNADIIAALGAVVTLNTERYVYDFFKHDVSMLVDAANNPDGENNRFLWYSRKCGTTCFQERKVYVRDTDAFSNWVYYVKLLGAQQTAIVQDRIHAFAVTVRGFENGRVLGDLYELDYGTHAGHVTRKALPAHTSIITFMGGEERTFPYEEVKNNREGIAYKYGSIKNRLDIPADTGELKDILEKLREERDNSTDTHAATFTMSNTSPHGDWLAYIRAQIKQLKNAGLSPDDVDLEISCRYYGERPDWKDAFKLFDEFSTDDLETIGVLWGKI